MRCKRCHTKLDPTKKMCPNCGTLVRKKRGSVKIASTAGVGPMWLSRLQDILNRIPQRTFYMGTAVIAALLMLLIVVGCMSCAGCLSCADCSSSCSGCSSSCSGCSSCKEDASSASGNAQEKTPEVKKNEKLNTGGKICVFDDCLYYVTGTTVMRSDASGETVVTTINYENSGALDTDGVNLYYLDSGSLWRLAYGGTTASDSMPVTRCVVRAMSEKDAVSGFVSVTGYGILETEKLCCWGAASDGSIRICTVDASGGALTEITRGSFSNPRYYDGAVYYYDNATGQLSRTKLETGGNESLGIAYNSAGYAIGGGFVYYCKTGANGTNTLWRMKLSDMTESEWFTEDPYIVGIMANDRYVCFWTLLPEGGDLYRYGHDGSGERFKSSASALSLNCIAGDYMLLLDGGQLRLYDGNGAFVQTLG